MPLGCVRLLRAAGSLSYRAIDCVIGGRNTNFGGVSHGALPPVRAAGRRKGREGPFGWPVRAIGGRCRHLAGPSPSASSRAWAWACLPRRGAAARCIAYTSKLARRTSLAVRTATCFMDGPRRACSAPQWRRRHRAQRNERAERAGCRGSGSTDRTDKQPVNLSYPGGVGRNAHGGSIVYGNACRGRGGGLARACPPRLARGSRDETRLGAAALACVRACGACVWRVL